MKRTLLILAAIILSVVSVLLYRNFTYEFEFKRGALHEEVISPDGKYTAKVYYHNYGGAAGGTNVYVNVHPNNNEANEATIYYSDGKDYFLVRWIEENKLYIINEGTYENRSAALTIGKEIYDERGKACLKYTFNKKYTCYSKKSKDVPQS